MPEAARSWWTPDRLDDGSRGSGPCAEVTSAVAAGVPGRDGAPGPFGPGTPDLARESIVDTVTHGLRLPYAAIAAIRADGDRLLAAESDAALVVRLPLVHYRLAAGELQVAPRPGKDDLRPAPAPAARVARQPGPVLAAHRLKLGNARTIPTAGDDAYAFPVLDELGLLEALRAAAVEVPAPSRVPRRGPSPRPARRPGVAAYRITGEALANVLRHADIRTCEITLQADAGLTVTITDDGRGLPPGLRPGVGLTSMRERAEEWHARGRDPFRRWHPHHRLTAVPQ